MESRNKFGMCRLCLCENECFVNIFELNDWQGYVASEVISDLLQFQVSETDAYPHVVCSKCLVKLTDFKLFKECCQKSIITYDHMFGSSESLKERKPEMVEFVSVKVEPIYHSDMEDNESKEINDHDIIDADEVKVEPFEEINDLDVSDRDEFKEEPVEDIIDDFSGSELCEEDPLGETSSDVRHAAVDRVTSSYHLQCIDCKTTQCTSKGTVDTDSCTRKISTESSSKIIKRSEGRWISPEKRLASFIQEDVGNSIEVEKEMKDKEMGEEEEVGKGSAPKKGVKEECGQLECYHCGKVLLSKNILIKHMKLHGFGHTYNCDVCGKAFQSKYGLTRHALIHTGTKPYKCAECRKYFSDNSSLKRHMRIHTGSKPYKCTVCGKCFSDNSNLKEHMRSHTGSKPYKCAECNKCFGHSSNLKVHMRIHTGHKPFKCGICSKGFTAHTTHRKHLLVHRKEKLP